MNGWILNKRDKPLAQSPPRPLNCHCVCSRATNKNAWPLAVDKQEREVDSKAAAILLSHKSSQVRDAENWCYFLPFF